MLYSRSPFHHDNANVMYGKIMEEEVNFPKECKFSEESVDLIKKLLKKNGSERIGYDDEQEIFTHPWFNDIVFSKLIEKQIPAIIIPQVEESSSLFKKSAGISADNGLNNPELDLSFENQKELKVRVPLVGRSRTDSGEGFSYFEEEDFVETALHEDDESDTHSAEEHRRKKFLETINDVIFSEGDGGSAEEEDSAFESPREMSREKSRDEFTNPIRKKSFGASKDQDFSEYTRKNERKLSGKIQLSEQSDGNAKDYSCCCDETENTSRRSQSPTSKNLEKLDDKLLSIPSPTSLPKEV